MNVEDRLWSYVAKCKLGGLGVNKVSFLGVWIFCKLLGGRPCVAKGHLLQDWSWKQGFEHIITWEWLRGLCRCEKYRHSKQSQAL
jgi:hypothetical protein